MSSYWYTNAIFYELYIRAFADSNGDGQGDIAGLRRKLDYLQLLGVDCIWLLPHYPSPLRDDGYDVASYWGIHPTYGQLEDFILLVEDVHRRGMRLITDLVLNHTSDQHPWFIEARRSKDSPLRDWYVWSETPDKYPGVPIIFPGVETSNWEYDAGSGEYYWHRFYSAQPDLNYDNPAVQEAMLKAARFWLDLGVDGFRVDAAAYLFEREGTSCDGLPETHDYIRRLRAMMDTDYPGTMLLAEANAMPEESMTYFGDAAKGGDEFQLCFNFPIMPRIYQVMATGDRAPLVNVVKSLPELPETAQWATFLRNHDELNLWLVSPEEREYLWDTYAPEMEQRIFTGIRRRLAPLFGNDQRRIELAHSLLFTLPGTPVLYYGDEIGMGDDVRLSDRNGVRTPMQWDGTPGGGFSDATPERWYAPTVNPQSANVAAQQGEPGSLFNAVRRMIAARKAMPWLGKAVTDWWEDAPMSIAAVWRNDPVDHSWLLAIHNLSDQALQVTPPLTAFVVDALYPDKKVDSTFTLPPYGIRWIVG